MMLKLGLSLVLAIGVLSACGTAGVKGEAPFVQVMSWQIDGSRLGASLRLRNVNDSELEVRALQLDVQLDGQPLARYQGAHAVTIPATGFETLELEMTASEAGVELLQQLQDGTRTSLPYRLQGTISTAELGELNYNRNGHLYTVPGRPGQFR